MLEINSNITIEEQRFKKIF